MNALKEPIFYDENLQRTFDEKGYVVVPLLTEEDVNDLLALYKNYEDKAGQGFFTSMNIDSYDERKKVHEEVVKRYFKKLPDYVKGYKPYIGSFAVKAPNAPGNIPLHLDWSAVDEHKYTSLNVWSPLVDVDEKNGCLGFLDGSQNFEFTYRGSHINNMASESYYEGDNILETIYNNYPAHLIPMKKGEAVIYNHSIAHYSLPNETNEPRISSSLVCIPEEAHPIHYHFADNGDVEVYKTSNEFYFKHKMGGNPAEDFEMIDRIPAERIKSRQDQTQVSIDMSGTRKSVPQKPQSKKNLFQRLFNI